MSKDVKRFYITPGSVPVLLRGDPAYTPMTNRLTDIHTAPLVLASEYDALLAERDAAQKDADRYRWLLRQAWFQSAFERYDFEDGGSQRLFELCAAEIIDHALQGDQP